MAKLLGKMPEKQLYTCFARVLHSRGYRGEVKPEALAWFLHRWAQSGFAGPLNHGELRQLYGLLGAWAFSSD
eukprot:9483517-Pyramimonas_sp.AAC.1